MSKMCEQPSQTGMRKPSTLRCWRARRIPQIIFSPKIFSANLSRSFWLIIEGRGNCFSEGERGNQLWQEATDGWCQGLPSLPARLTRRRAEVLAATLQETHQQSRAIIA